ncbi:MAG TPA: hypothetical protein VLK82_11850, partial [Candidatus Tectomicrobia bacterium]|nr:hypothetical protein [Candidatus Tectomicrobia bacterium]
RKALQTYSRTDSVQELIETVRALYQYQRAVLTDAPANKKPSKRIAREDLKLICYEYIYA